MLKKSPSPVRKAVFPVAGFGTRLLPATKALPKEMLPIVDKPIIQYAFEEAREAGIEQFIFITGRNKEIIEDHFDHAVELQRHLANKAKKEELDRVADWLPPAGNIFFTRQQEMLGLGHAVWCARNLVGNEPFAVLLPDDMVLNQGKGCLAQMMDAYATHGGNIIGIEEIPREQTGSYGIITPEGQAQGAAVKIKSLVEKPKPADAPSNLGIIGRYILQPEIFEVLERQKPGAGGEIQLTDGLQAIAASQPMHGYQFAGTRFDCGSQAGYVNANVAYAKARPELAAALKL